MCALLISVADRSGSGKLGAVVIGRNEGDRLGRCLASVRFIPRRVYVDSGSTDGSVALARGEGFKLVELTAPPHFSAARARNAGLAELLADDPDLEFVQMVDGDCEVQAPWIAPALEVLQADPKLALVFGRLRERHPERSIYNALCDDEWNVPPGHTTGVGGNALFRVAALREVGCYRPGIIAGEELDLAYRLRERGWQLRVIGAEMALHDANITRFAQWWTRSRRTGYGCAQLASLHPKASDARWSGAISKMLVWCVAVPGVLIVAVLLALLADARWWAVATLACLTWPLNIARLALREHRRGLSPKLACSSGILLMVGKLPQLIGLISYWLDRVSHRSPKPIEYKANAT
jgi:glycosyltransferase involved in cell wall biosynthesis